jgi:2'-5' RNA ligase
MAGRRVFIGFHAGQALSDAVAGFRRLHDGMNVRWILSENLHVTMVPPWETEDPDLVCSLLGELASGFAAVPVRFDVVSFGPEPGHPRLVWATGEAPAALRGLAALLKGAFGGGNDAGREFLLHLTIARIKRQEGRPLSDLKLHEPIEWNTELDTLCLYESVLKPTGAEYRVLCRISLAGN